MFGHGLPAPCCRRQRCRRCLEPAAPLFHLAPATTSRSDTMQVLRDLGGFCRQKHAAGIGSSGRRTASERPLPTGCGVSAALPRLARTCNDCHWHDPKEHVSISHSAACSGSPAAAPAAAAAAAAYREPLPAARRAAGQRRLHPALLLATSARGSKQLLVTWSKFVLRAHGYNPGRFRTTERR